MSASDPFTIFASDPFDSDPFDSDPFATFESDFESGHFINPTPAPTPAPIPPVSRPLTPVNRAPLFFTNRNDLNEWNRLSNEDLDLIDFGPKVSTKVQTIRSRAGSIGKRISRGPKKPEVAEEEYDDEDDLPLASPGGLDVGRSRSPKKPEIAEESHAEGDSPLASPGGLDVGRSGSPKKPEVKEERHARDGSPLANPGGLDIESSRSPKKPEVKEEENHAGRNPLGRVAPTTTHQRLESSPVWHIIEEINPQSQPSPLWDVIEDRKEWKPSESHLRPTTVDEVSVASPARAPHTVSHDELPFEETNPIQTHNTQIKPPVKAVLIPDDPQHPGPPRRTEFWIPGSWPADDAIKFPETIEFTPYEVLWIDKAKLWLENRLKTKIFWWPLEAPVRTEPGAYLLKMTWRCSCGEKLSEVIDHASEGDYRSIYHCVPLATNASATTIQTVGHISSQLPTTTTPSVPPPSRRRHERANNIPVQQQCQNVPTTPQPTNVFANARVMCCVPRTEQHSLLAQLPQAQERLSSDEQFFRELRGVYNAIRGWRRWFGLSCVTRITFLRFSRYRIRHDYADCHGPEGLPTIKDPEYEEYEFCPKPPPTPAAIPRCLLLHLFKDPSCAGTTSAVLENIPKRINGELPHDVTTAWGLQLQQTLCHKRVTCLFLAFWILSMAFAGWWISGHPGDLQNAAVPGTVFAAVGTVLVAILPAHFSHDQNLPSSAP
ncbi:hypothetical protein K440DRAFT_641098 [Wilcoxina mikolae CBS 423.85]|nr:hypothetical protein K440DRAFT_641098 [Wilcoxina mikolae CBS 423.85]